MKPEFKFEIQIGEQFKYSGRTMLRIADFSAKDFPTSRYCAVGMFTGKVYSWRTPRTLGDLIQVEGTPTQARYDAEKEAWDKQQQQQQSESQVPPSVWGLKKHAPIYWLAADGGIYLRKWSDYWQNDRAHGRIFLILEQAKAERDRAKAQANVAKTIHHLYTLAQFIEDHVGQYQLNMSHFRTAGTGTSRPVDLESIKPPHECGTSGCALGWAPFSPDLPPKGEQVDWFEYSQEVFPSILNQDGGEDWEGVFGDELSSKKKVVIQRLRDKARELAGGTS